MSLVPSLTELVCALGLGAQLVGRTGFCIHPADAVRVIPKIGGTKDVQLDRLRRLRPSHVLLNVDENRRETADAIAAWPADERPQCVITHPGGPQDVLAVIDQLLGHFAAHPGLRPDLRVKLVQRAARLSAAIEAALASTRPDGRPPSRVLYLIWRGPWMTVARDTYLSRMLARVGWHTWPEVEGGPHGAGRYPVLKGDEAWLADIDRVLLSSEPYAFGPQHRAEAQALCPRARIDLVDGEALSWYGSRTLDGLQLLRRLADPSETADEAAA